MGWDTIEEWKQLLRVGGISETDSEEPSTLHTATNDGVQTKKHYHIKLFRTLPVNEITLENI